MAHIHTLHRAAGIRSVLLGSALLAIILCPAIPAGAQVNAPAWWDSPDNNTISLGFLFDDSTFAPVPNHAVTPGWYTGSTWTRGGARTPEWAALLADHTGVWGFTDGQAGEGYLQIQLANQSRSGWVKHVWYQFDLYQVSSDTCCVHAEPGTGTVFNEVVDSEQLPFGWYRVTGSFDIIPQPEWETLRWNFVAFAAGKTAIDNLYVGTHCEMVPEPSSLVFLGPSALGLLAIIRRRR